ncbi:MAG TPA: DUF1772 domain-containing protein [Chitinophagaceae bacterium]|jgi:uncharacterized membrane protein|nr:DUF1772 domain-containing protein [Chitinophagaceae bacterium]
MKLKTTEFAALILAALVMGVFWGTWFTLTRSIPDFSAAEFIHIGKTIIANVATPMSILMPTTLLMMLLVMWQSYRVNKISFYLYSLSFLLMVVTLIITVGVEVPIDNQIKTWTETTVPANWESLRHTWNQFHTIRTFTSIASVAFFTLGIIKRI